MKKTILVVGSALMDLSLNMARIPDRGQTLTDDGGVAYLPGGSAIELSAALTRLGASCLPVTKLGADAHGKRLYEYMSALSLDVSATLVDREMPTGLRVSLRDGGADRRVVYPGANLAIGEEMLRHAFDLADPAGVLIALDVPFATALTAARIAESRGIPIFIDPTSASEEHKLEELPHVEIFLPNEVETKCYTGVLPMGADVSLRAALALRKRLDASYILLKLGARGSFLYDGKRRDVVAPIVGCRIPEDATGLGTAYTAALCAAYVSGTEIRSAMRFATAAAALTATRALGVEGFPTAPEVLAFQKQYNPSAP